ncbi:MAG: methanogenesis marker 17 protein [Candidatus Nezhaarchaeota archaeon]|nr:methanogenesis marker 17 protein [Candidatus Nezhaarchaeota archaeon]MCX8141674.1 methanogenesis marker 17 protein [Candidatus Nezhaarchaeota archaeon]MDW8049941.1 methanogenesis marker 17 protein [Nitrososphaerota archaeon]
MKLQVKVEGESGELYERLIRDLVMELNVKGAIESLAILIDPTKPLFAINMQTRPSSKIIRLGEVTEITKSRDYVTIKILDERFSPDIINALEKAYGNMVFHVSRHEVLIKGDVDEKALENTPICDYAKVIERSIMELVHRVTPEGFRSVKILRSEGEVLLIASEDPLTDEMELEVKRKLKKMIN